MSQIESDSDVIQINESDQIIQNPFKKLKSGDKSENSIDKKFLKFLTAKNR